MTNAKGKRRGTRYCSLGLLENMELFLWSHTRESVPFSGNRNSSLQSRHKSIHFCLAFYHNVYIWYYLISLILHSEPFSGLPASLSFDLLMAFPRAFFSHPLMEAKLSLFFYIQYFFLSSRTLNAQPSSWGPLGPMAQP